MVTDHWPLFGLRIRTPRLELRYPDDDLVAALADLAVQGIHDPSTMPFSVPWTRQPDGVLQRESLKHHWARRAETSPERWSLPMAVLEGGTVVGVQDVHAAGFVVNRTVETGSWLGRAHQGRGIGKEMRAAVLHLAFDGLGAELARTGCWDDNAVSEAVTRSLGYDDDGWTWEDREGVRARMRRFRLERSAWRRRDDVRVDGLAPCLPLLGLA
jgi:RimJ/RimL family protein N-acetyltransferase